MTASDGARGFLIDGFPRNQRNLDGRARHMSAKTRLSFVLVFTAPKEVLVQRCRGRVDDTEETLTKRILRYNDETMPVVQHFEAQHIVRTINGFRGRDEVRRLPIWFGNFGIWWNSAKIGSKGFRSFYFVTAALVGHH